MVQRELLQPHISSCSGPDGSGKDTAIDGAMKLLFNEFDGEDLRVARLDRPPMIMSQAPNGDVITEKHFLRPFRFINRLHSIGDRSGKPRIVQLANAMNVVSQGWFVRPSMQRHYRPDIITGSRNYWTDPAAYAELYAPELAKLNMEERIRYMRRISGVPMYDTIYLFRIDPALAVERIESRIDAEKVKPTGQPAWRHQHETVECLTGLNDRFQSIPQALSLASPQTEVVKFDTGTLTKAEVAVQMGEHMAEQVRRRRYMANPSGTIYSLPSRSTQRKSITA